MIHAFPRAATSRWSWCYQVRKLDVVKWLGGGSASKLRKRVTCPECKSRLGMMLSVS